MVNNAFSARAFTVLVTLALSATVAHAGIIRERDEVSTPSVLNVHQEAYQRGLEQYVDEQLGSWTPEGYSKELLREQALSLTGWDGVNDQLFYWFFEKTQLALSEAAKGGPGYGCQVALLFDEVPKRLELYRSANASSNLWSRPKHMTPWCNDTLKDIPYNDSGSMMVGFKTIKPSTEPDADLFVVLLSGLDQRSEYEWATAADFNPFWTGNSTSNQMGLEAGTWLTAIMGKVQQEHKQYVPNPYRYGKAHQNWQRTKADIMKPLEANDNSTTTNTAGSIPGTTGSATTQGATDTTATATATSTSDSDTTVTRTGTESINTDQNGPNPTQQDTTVISNTQPFVALTASATSGTTASVTNSDTSTNTLQRIPTETAGPRPPENNRVETYHYKGVDEESERARWVNETATLDSQDIEEQALSIATWDGAGDADWFWFFDKTWMATEVKKGDPGWGCQIALYSDNINLRYNLSLATNDSSVSGNSWSSATAVTPWCGTNNDNAATKESYSDEAVGYRTIRPSSDPAHDGIVVLLSDLRQDNTSDTTTWTNATWVQTSDDVGARFVNPNQYGIFTDGILEAVKQQYSNNLYNPYKYPKGDPVWAKKRDVILNYLNKKDTTVPAVTTAAQTDNSALASETVTGTSTALVNTNPATTLVAPAQENTGSNTGVTDAMPTQTEAATSGADTATTEGDSTQTTTTADGAQPTKRTVG